MDWMANPEIWIALATLTALEIVLGVDNIIFIAVLAGKLPAAQQERARLVGLLGAMFMRIGLLLARCEPSAETRARRAASAAGDRPW